MKDRLGLPPEMVPAIRALADGIAFARRMKEDRTPWAMAQAALWSMREAGWTVNPTATTEPDDV